MTQDLAWLRTVGWALLDGIAKFWMSKLRLDNGEAALTGAGAHAPLLQILNVVGPDEYHDHTNNSAYTSAGVRPSSCCRSLSLCI
jgi:trehalose/maltose hydrolase-like predicted phosphorylase|eukprot:COSAG06_NODE_13916_length_1205_cov_13.541411_2_plen_85_part_00